MSIFDQVSRRKARRRAIKNLVKRCADPPRRRSWLRAPAAVCVAGLAVGWCASLPGSATSASALQGPGQAAGFSPHPAGQSGTVGALLTAAVSASRGTTTGRGSVGFRFSTRNNFGRPAGSIDPAPPTGLMAAGGDGQVSLTWSAPAADGGPAVTGYDVYEGTSSGGEASVPVNPAPVSGTSYTVGSLANGTTYYFTVTSVSADAQSVPSGEASATPAPAVTLPPVASGALPGQIILLAAVCVIAAAAIALATRRRRQLRLRSTPTAPPNVRAEQHSGSPALVTVHATGTEPTHTVRIEPDSGSRVTTIEEVRP